jgi:hypothetical protein
MAPYVDIIGEPITDSFPKVGQNVYVKAAWDDDWTYTPFIQVEEVEDAAAPTVGRSRFVYRYGSVEQPGTIIREFILPLYINGGFVKIEVWTPFSTTLLFVGEIDAESVNPFGFDYPAGVQAFTCFDLKQVLDRIDVRGSWVAPHPDADKYLLPGPSYPTDPTDFELLDIPVFIDKTLTFNKTDGRGVALQGNRSADVDSNGAHYFSSDGELWTHFDIINYILINFAKNATFPVVVDGMAQESLEGIVEEFDPDGLKVKMVLDQLILRQRSMGWTITPTDDGILHVFVFSSLPYELTIGDITVPANTEQHILDTAQAAGVDPRISFDQLKVYTEVLVEGGPVRTTATFSYADGTLEAGWDAAQEAAYAAGTGNSDDTAAKHDAARKADKFDGVYQRHNVPQDWDGLVGDGTGHGVIRPVAPVPDTIPPWTLPAPPDGKFYLDTAMPACDDHAVFESGDASPASPFLDPTANFYRPELRFDRQTGLEDEAKDASGIKEFRPLIALVRLVDPDFVVGSAIPVDIYTITSSTDATPIEVTVDSAHSLVTGNAVEISGHLTNTNANGTRLVTVTGATTFTITDTAYVDIAGNGSGPGSGGTATYTIPAGTYTITSSTDATPIEITVDSAHSLVTGNAVEISEHLINTNANGTRLVTVTSATTFTITNIAHEDIAGNGSGSGSGGTATTTADPLSIMVDALDALQLPPASVRPLEKDLGVLLRVQGINHSAAGAIRWAALDPAPNASETEPLWDFKTLSITAQIETHEKLTYLAGNMDAPALGAPRRKTIPMEGAELWILAPHTITDVVNGVSMVSTNHEVIRDDTERMKVFGELAAHWYGTPKATVSVVHSWLNLTTPTGSMITALKDGSGQTWVNSPVTSRTFTFNPTGLMKTTVQTGYEEREFEELI